MFSGDGVLKPVVPWPLTDGENEVAELALPLYTDDPLKDPPLGEGDAEFDCACIWGSAGSRSPYDIRGVHWGLHHAASPPRELTWEIEGRARFAFSNVLGLRARCRIPHRTTGFGRMFEYCDALGCIIDARSIQLT